MTKRRIGIAAALGVAMLLCFFLIDPGPILAWLAPVAFWAWIGCIALAAVMIVVAIAIAGRRS